MSVATGPIQAAFCETFVDELVRAGVTDAVVSPGSRSTPLALAIAASPLRRHIRLDERSACFVALGLARSTGRAVLVLVTSGTAAAELHAGVVEAHLDRVPLIVATADRPPELHGVGAPQTIDQHGIFGAHVLSAIDPGPVHALPLSAWRPLVSRLVLDATAGVHPGPVVINLPFVEPLVAELRHECRLPDLARIPMTPDERELVMMLHGAVMFRGMREHIYRQQVGDDAEAVFRLYARAFLTGAREALRGLHGRPALTAPFRLRPAIR